MSLIRDLAELPAQLRSGAISIGNFDGVHLGHARIIERLCGAAKAIGGASIVFTFDPHPVSILRPDQTPPLLTSIERKAELLTKLGVDAVVAYPTDASTLELSAEEFFRRFLVETFAAGAMVEGPNFFFGKDRGGDIQTLAKLCESQGVKLEIVDPVPLEDADFVSSSRLREWIASGRIEDANRMLTEPYRIGGVVAHGDSRGRAIGFPTANLTEIPTLLPAKGVYAGVAHGPQFSRPAAINIGPKPTFSDARPSVEAHLLDFDGDLYHQPLELEFSRRLRDVVAFGNVDELRSQLESDIAAVRELN